MSSDDSPLAPHPTSFSWRVHLVREHPQRLPWLILILLAAGGLAFALFGNLILSIVVILFLLGAVSEYVFPIEYRLTHETAEVRNGLSWRRIAWPDVRRTMVRDAGVQLSPFARPTRLDATRGVFLRFADNRDDVISAVDRFRNDRIDS